ncbi:hypothetical protein [Chroococcidiopsis sp. CCMEE 29]|uniref:hypothetical protein n=1 Tax=Chroococcidiopsis sp. CCMEE 29 TaxID=155894 RepID=UPI002020B357|nr:hypothetical protein [Chroococcidiopsis sp. CCMEE 29]
MRSLSGGSDRSAIAFRWLRWSAIALKDRKQGAIAWGILATGVRSPAWMYQMKCDRLQYQTL